MDQRHRHSGKLRSRRAVGIRHSPWLSEPCPPGPPPSLQHRVQHPTQTEQGRPGLARCPSRSQPDKLHSGAASRWPCGPWSAERQQVGRAPDSGSVTRGAGGQKHTADSPNPRGHEPSGFGTVASRGGCRAEWGARPGPGSRHVLIAAAARQPRRDTWPGPPTRSPLCKPRTWALIKAD